MTAEPLTRTVPEQRAHARAVGKDRAHVDRLWIDFRAAIDTAYRAGDHNAPTAVLRDYVRNMSWSDKLETLLTQEAADEREHQRSGRRLVGDIGKRPAVAHLSRLMVLHAAGQGAARPDMPPATDWLVYRRAHVEAEILGFLIRAHVTPEWVAACCTLDYSEAVK